MPQRYQPTERTWGTKFADAFAAVFLGIKGQGSFYVHLVLATAVVIAGVVFQVTRIEWCLLVLCIFSVLSAEMFNRALELLAPAITKNQSRDLEIGLNVASAAVLLISIGAVIVGLLIFIPRLIELLPV